MITDPGSLIIFPIKELGDSMTVIAVISCLVQLLQLLQLLLFLRPGSSVLSDSRVVLR